jgi:CelD/BcsL family acetyltransferase involved in cellulose biosynthesis
VPIFAIDPLTDGRWEQFAAHHPRASIFHQTGWLRALSQSYGYKPLALTHAGANEPLRDGMVFCLVSSWMTGKRLVSLPFSDHCEPLVGRNGEFNDFVDWLRIECDRESYKYAELRPLSWYGTSNSFLHASKSYYIHTLSLEPALEQIFRGLHKDSIQRKIRRAERENLSYEIGNSRQLVDEFSQLLIKTRRRQLTLPQPRYWFENLIACMGEKIKVRVARKDGVAIAAIVTLRHQSAVVYKYGCSDERYHPLGGMPFLFWRLIEESKADGAAEIDYGRSDMDGAGLIQFKDRFGAEKKLLQYFRYSYRGKSQSAATTESSTMRQLVTILPSKVSSLAGRILYKHMG